MTFTNVLNGIGRVTQWTHFSMGIRMVNQSTSRDFYLNYLFFAPYMMIMSGNLQVYDGNVKGRKDQMIFGPIWTKKHFMLQFTCCMRC